MNENWFLHFFCSEEMLARRYAWFGFLVGWATLIASMVGPKVKIGVVLGITGFGLFFSLLSLWASRPDECADTKARTYAIAALIILAASLVIRWMRLGFGV